MDKDDQYDPENFTVITYLRHDPTGTLARYDCSLLQSKLVSGDQDDPAAIFQFLLQTRTPWKLVRTAGKKG